MHFKTVPKTVLSLDDAIWLLEHKLLNNSPIAASENKLESTFNIISLIH